MLDAFNGELKISVEKKCTEDRWYGLKNGKMKRGVVAKEFSTLAKQLHETLGDHAKKNVHLLEAMAAYAKEVYRNQALEELQIDKLTESTIFEMCQKEPWTTAKSVWDMEKGTGGSVYGYVTDRLGVAMMLFSEGSQEREKIAAAFDEASSIYNDQVTSMAFAASRKISDERSQEIRQMLWSMAGLYEGEQTTRAARLTDLATKIGEYHHNQNQRPDHDIRPVRPESGIEGEFQKRKPKPNIGDQPSPL